MTTQEDIRAQIEKLEGARQSILEELSRVEATIHYQKGRLSMLIEIQQAQPLQEQESNT